MCAVALHAAGAWPADGRCALPRRCAPRLRFATLRCSASADAGAAADAADAAAAQAVADSPLSAALRGWRRAATLRDGTRIIVRPAAVSEGPAVADMLADAFAASMGAAQYRKFLGRQVSTYIAARLATPPEEAVLLVAVPCDATGNGDGDGVAGDEAASAPPALLGVLEVSLTPRTHGRFDDAAVAPPPGAAFVKNVLSAPDARRRGVAAALLDGVEDYAAAAADARAALNVGGAAENASPSASIRPPPLELCLHCMQGDAPASALYTAAGYTTVAQQNGVVAALRLSAPAVSLMCKRLRP